MNTDDNGETLGEEVLSERFAAPCATKHPDRTPVLETERLILRPLNVEDADAAFRGWASDADVARFMTWDLHRSIADTQEWLSHEQACIDDPANYTFGYVLKETGALIGSGGIVYNDEAGGFILGYNLRKDCWGFGYATEAARCIMRFATCDLAIETVFSSHAVDNPASGNVLRKAGFRYVADGLFVNHDGSRRFPRKEYRYDAEAKQP